MNPLNSILLEGNIVREVTAHETPKGTPVCQFSIASNRGYRTENGTYDKEVSFFDVEAWGNLAAISEKNCIKGRGVRVVGRLKQGRWKAEDGKTHSKITVVAEHIEFKPVFQKNEAAAGTEETEPQDQTELNIEEMAEAAVF